MSETFIRFVIRDRDDESGFPQGIFQPADRLLSENLVDGEDHSALDELLKWFAQNLATPTRFKATKSKGWWRRDRHGICWFRATALEHVSKCHQMAGILRRNGLDVVVITTSRPGYIAYKDSYQVVAEPFADLAEAR